MAIKSLWVIFAGLLLLSATVCLVWGQNSSLGVKEGDTFIYSYIGAWESNQTGAEPPSSIGDQTTLQFIAFAIMDVEGVSITTNTSYCYDTGIMMEIATSDYGGGYMPFFVPPNLGAGSLVPATYTESGPITDCYINDTTTQIFGSQTRTVNHLQLEVPFEGFAEVSCNAYWDQATGAMTQVTYSYSNQTGDTSTIWSVTVKLIETSLFAISNSQSPPPSTSSSPSQSPLPSSSPSPTIPYLSYGIAIIIAILIIIAIILALRHKGSTPKLQ